MSLLLEALKKAELAKQRAVSPPDDAVGERATPVITRERLPDIGEHVEIRTDDLPSAQSASAVARDTRAARPLELALAPEQEPVPAPSRGERPVAENQEAARRLFEVKEIDYNPRRPFYLTLVALGVVGVAYGGYVWWQLQPKYTYSTPAVRDAKDKSVPVARTTAPVAPPAPAVAPAATTVAAPAAAGERFQPKRAAAAPQRPATPLADRGAQRKAPVAPRIATARPAPRPSDTSVAAVAPPSDPSGTSRQSIAITPASMQLDPQLERAYEAVQRNDLEAARQIYQSVLQREPSNRDALLGMATIEVRTRSYEIAEARYLRLLELDPRDPYAQAGLLALRQADPVASESRLKNLLASQPDSPQLQFALGNQYALQSRWSEAQQAYFRALAVDPENPDYAFNLAVSLDHLHQKTQAVEFYRRSLALSERRPGSFDRALAAARARDLQR